MTTAYKGFPAQSGPAPSRMPSICVITNELVGPFKNGGIGTSMTGFAECMVKAGFAVTVLYTGGQFLSVAARDHWRGKYAGIGITLNWLHSERTANLHGPLVEQGFAAPYLVYEALRESKFDILQFNDCMGEGFYCLTMKRLGMAFQNSVMTVGLHSPAQWIFEINRTLPEQPLVAAFNFAERLSTQCADLLWSPSHYLLDWIQAHEFTIPAATYVQQYAIPTSGFLDDMPGELAELPATGIRTQPKEIVFFGRIEERKGIRLFCAMLAELNDVLTRDGIKIKFLGKPSQVGDLTATEFLHEQSAAWRFEWDVVSNLGQQEALAYLRTAQPLIVMPSPADNSPCTVYEALSFGLPFIAARTGGIPELVAEADRDAVLFDYDLPSLATKVADILEHGIAPARAAFTPAEIRRHWVNAFSDLPALITQNADPQEAERALSVLVDHQAGADLDTILASFPATARVMIINRSGAPLTATADMRISHLSMAGKPAEALRTWINDGADHALLMLQSGAVLMPGAFPDFLKALRHPEISGLMPAAITQGGKTIPPLGGSQSFCYLQGAMQTGGILIKADRLLPAIDTARLFGGSAFFGLADLAIAGGLEIWPYADPVLHLPAPIIARSTELCTPERIAAYAASSPIERYYIMAIGMAGQGYSGLPIGRIRAVRDFLLRKRAGWVISLAKKVVPRRLVIAILARR